MTLSRIVNFVRRYYRHPLYILVYGVLYPIPGFRIRIHIYSEDEVRELLSAGKSVIRFGDGEINLLLGLRNHYHEYAPRLRSMLQNIVRGYGPTSPYVLAVPGALTVRNDRLREIQRFNIWLPFKTMFLLSFPKRMAYLDAHSFYYDGYLERVVAPALTDARIVLVTNAKTIQKQQANPRLPWKDIRYVTTPEVGLLEAYDDTVRAIDAVLAVSLEGRRSVLLFAVGPVGKDLVRNYSEKGYQSIDIGRGAEVMFTDESIEQLI